MRDLEIQSGLRQCLVGDFTNRVVGEILDVRTPITTSDTNQADAQHSLGAP